jgi:predicted nucleic acid-binding protein
MPLNLPTGTRCLIDANIFYYHYVDTPPLSDTCSDFLQRVLDGDLIGFTSIHLAAEAIHKVMLGEAASRFARQRAGILGWLQQHPGSISQLSDFESLAGDFSVMNLTMLNVDGPTLIAGAGISRVSGLFTNDAIALALMRREGLDHLVTNDDDFDGVGGLTVWKPR